VGVVHLSKQHDIAIQLYDMNAFASIEMHSSMLQVIKRQLEEGGRGAPPKQCNTSLSHVVL